SVELARARWYGARPQHRAALHAAHGRGDRLHISMGQRRDLLRRPADHLQLRHHRTSYPSKSKRLARPAARCGSRRLTVMSENQTLKHIACIDDDEDILRVAELTLELMGGFKVTTFSSGAAALAGLAAAAPDLVLLDVMMPKMDGLATF